MEERGRKLTSINAEPVLVATRYDKVFSNLSVVALGLFVTVIVLAVIWFFNKPRDVESLVPVEYVELAGGSESGAIDEMLQFEAAEDIVPDPALEENPDEAPELEEILEQVVDLSEQATEQLPPTSEAAEQSTGRVGSAAGTGRRALGSGPGESGLPREQRWYIQFDNTGSLEDYARQLDFFGIELGALTNEGTLVYLSKMSSPNPTTRQTTSGKSENRLYMTWQAGPLKQADLKLFSKAGLELRNATLFHFYPPQTEAMLAKLEFEFQGLKADQIRRTYFNVKRVRNGYEFEVTRQTVFR